MLEINSKKISVNNIIVVVLFITPHVFLSIFPKSFSSYYSIIIYTFALGFFITKGHYLSSKYKKEITIQEYVRNTYNLDSHYSSGATVAIHSLA